MPHGRLMFGPSRLACAVLTAVVTLVAVPAAAQTVDSTTTSTSSTTTTTTVAPPPPTSPPTAPAPPPTTPSTPPSSPSSTPASSGGPPTSRGPSAKPHPRVPAARAKLPAAAIGAGPPQNGTSTVPLPPGALPPALAPAPNLPPPAPFTLSSDFGTEMVNELQAAQAALKADTAKLAPAEQRLAAAKKHAAAVRPQVVKLKAKARPSVRRLDGSRARLRQAAAEAYIHAGSGQLEAAVSALMSAQSAVDIGSELHVLGTWSSSLKSAFTEYVTLKPQVDEKFAVINAVADRSTQEVNAARLQLADVQRQIAKDKAAVRAATDGIARFHAAATSASSPILGPSRLTAKQMADFVVASGGHPRITVPLVELAQDYLDEGVATGVRGDVAFAQSILETGAFADPGSAPTDNNFAGIGWCDTCAHGFDFANARTGVRAQLQLLRIYVDPNFPEANYKDPILLRGSLSLGFRGKVQTWWDLWGTWATGAIYGQRVYDIYERMVAFSRTDPTPAVPVVAKPSTSVTAGTNGVIRPPNTGPGTKP